MASARSRLILVEIVVSIWLCDWIEYITVEKTCFQKKNADYFGYNSWTWNLFQRPQSVQGNVESKAWRRTKCAYRTKQLCIQICGQCWKRYKSCQTFNKSSVGKICKDYLISFKMTITQIVLLKYLAEYAILRMEVPSSFYLTGALMTYTLLHKGGWTVSDFTKCPICYLDEMKIIGKKTFC